MIVRFVSDEFANPSSIVQVLLAIETLISSRDSSAEIRTWNRSGTWQALLVTAKAAVGRMNRVPIRESATSSTGFEKSPVSHVFAIHCLVSNHISL